MLARLGITGIAVLYFSSVIKTSVIPDQGLGTLEMNKTENCGENELNSIIIFHTNGSRFISLVRSNTQAVSEDKSTLAQPAIFITMSYGKSLIKNLHPHG